MKLIAIANYKGGVGKSCLAIHLAAALAPSALLVDGDPTNESCIHWAAAGKLPFQVVRNAEARNAIAQLSPEFVVIDSPARPDPESIANLVRANLVVVPTFPDSLCIGPTQKLLRDLVAAAPDCAIAIAPVGISSRAQSGRRHSSYANGRDIAKLREWLGTSAPFLPPIRNSKGPRAACDRGVTVRDLPAHKSKVWQDYCQLAKVVKEKLDE